MGDSGRRHVALLHYAGPPVVGGVESVMGHHARLMHAAGHKVRIIAGRGDSIAPGIEFREIPLVDSQNPEVLQTKQCLDRGQVPASFERLTDAILEQLTPALADVDVLFLHNVCSLAKNLCLTAAIRKLGSFPQAPNIVVWHHDLAGTATRYQQELHEGWPWNLILEDWPEVERQHVVVSAARCDELCGLLGIPPEKVEVIPSGIDTDLFHGLEPVTSELVGQLGLLRCNPLLLLPVRITRRKNIELAIRVIAELGKTFPGTALVVTGPPGAHNASNRDYFDSLQSLRRELSLEPDSSRLNGGNHPVVHFLSEAAQSYMPDEVIADFYQIADGLLLTSRDEGFGIPIIEAGLARVPIFCTDIGPFREIAGDFATYFSSEDSPEHIAQCIAETLVSDPKHALRQHVKSTYSWEAVYQEQIEPLLGINSGALV